MSVNRPVLIFDGKCGFCRIWINYWRKLTGDRIEYLPSQEVGDRFPQIPFTAYAESVQLVRPDGSVASGARAVFESLNRESLYVLFASFAEPAYRLIARHRDFAYQVNRFTFGRRVEPDRFEATQWIFLRLLALVYAAAFGSLAMQVTGLIGEHGLLPVRDFLNSVTQSFGGMRYIAVPSLFWWGSDDRNLLGLAIAGVVLAALLFITGFRKSVFERFLLGALFVLYLSFSAIGQDFLQFQWDSLLLETGFLAIFLGRTKIVPWLFRWLVFRLFFLSGAVKLLSQDPSWRNLSALSYHYHTQPLPTVLAWYADKLPGRVQHFSTAATLVIELAIPFFIFLPRMIRMFGAWCLIGLQALIALTGNYAFFNLLTVALTLFLFDDLALERFVPSRARLQFGILASQMERTVVRVVAVIIVALGVAHLLQTFRGVAPRPLNLAIRYTAPFQIVNTYGLFAVMTTERNEIILEGSNDGQNWLPYEFRYKPGNVDQRPRWIEPFQPRLDWQMWFAALSNFRSNPWFVNLAVKLLQGDEAVLSLLAGNPFPVRPPKFVRATVYQYTFSDADTRRRTGAWWARTPRGLYLPVVGLRTGQN